MPHLFGALVLLVALVGAGSAAAQPTLSWSGLTYLDYVQPLHHSEHADVRSAFSLRRLYLTADARLSPAFSGRARLEVNQGTRSERGLPFAFVKDLYVRWEAPRGHRLTFGLQPTPAFQLGEAVWGYRSLTRALPDAAGAVASRDFGLAAHGPIAGRFRYGLMVGNNEGVRVEDDDHKRVYGEVQWTSSGPLAFSLHADYASYDDDRDDAVTLSAFGGVETERFRLGAEAVWQRTRLPAGAEHLSGVSAFAVLAVTERVDIVARSNWTARALPDEEIGLPAGPTYLLGAVSYQPVDDLYLIPNVFWDRPEEGDDLVIARFTLSASF